MLSQPLTTQRPALDLDSDRALSLGFVTGAPAIILRLEGATAFVLAMVAYRYMGGAWLQCAALFLVPDLSVLGYLTGPRVGAAVYNLVHTYCGPAILFLISMVHLFPIGSELGIQLAAIWTAHIGLDRLLGFGLKHASAFSDSHLGRPRRGR